MVTFSILALAAASVLPMASAEACKTGLNYCGYTLRQIGDYSAEIDAELHRNGIPNTYANINSGLYTCGVGGKGWIGLIGVCRECVDGGRDKSDYCRRFGPS